MTSRRSQIALQPEVLLWARERAGITRDDLARKMQVKIARVAEWEETGSISIAQADRLAARTHTPLGFLYLSKPPEEGLPIPDFRASRADATHRDPSVDLLETVYSMQQRQAWMHEDLISSGADPLSFVGEFNLQSGPSEVADGMRRALGVSRGWARTLPSWIAALRFLRDRLDASRILVVFNGIVGNSTRRKLNRDEFQGFALVNEYAPLIFINNTDFIAAKMFTLAHELAHICVGESGVSDFKQMRPSPHLVERFCDKAAAEFLVPELSLRQLWQRLSITDNIYQAVARYFKVSEIVAARRLLDLELIERDSFFAFYEERKQQGWTPPSSDDGGDFWNTQRWRIGPQFAAAIVRATREGRVTYREAQSLTGLRGDAFDSLAVKMDIPL